MKMNLPARKITNTVLKICNFKQLLKEREDQINSWLKDQKENDFYLPKNKFWLTLANREDADFLYLDEGEGNDFYYDLVTVEFEEKQIAIPVPILAEAMDIKERDIYDCFSKRENRDDIEFI